MKLYDFTVRDTKGKEVALEQYKGKVVLVINSATECGFTPQYELLQSLYEKYESKGFVILDFPCDQFGHQAPGSDEQIVTFCTSTFRVSFPIFSKVEVNGENADPLFKYLIGEKGFAGFSQEHRLTPILDKMLSDADANYQENPSIKWNFTKFLIDQNGTVLQRYEPTEPIEVIEERIKAIL